MWRTCEDRAYPFKHHHTNLFPPPPKSNDYSDCEDVPIVFFGQNQEMESIVRTRNYPLTTPKTPPPFILFEPSGELNQQLLFVPEDEEDMSPKTPTPAPLRPRIPMIRSATEKNFQPPSPPPTFTLPSPQKSKIIRNTANSSQRPSTPPSSTKKPNLLRIQTGPAPPTTTSKNPPPTPSALAPHHLTGLLQEVLSIMNTIMSQQTIVQEEEEVLRDLTELVVIMQDEAEVLVNMADLVEEYVDEIAIAEQAAEIQEWVSDLELDSLLGATSSPTKKNHEEGRGGDRKKDHVRQQSTRIRHEREDSGIGLDSESEIDPQRNFQVVIPYQHQNNNNNISTPTKPALSPNIFTPPHRIQQQQASPPRSSQKKAPSYARPTVASQKHPSRTKSKNSPQPFRDSGLDILSPVGISLSSSGRSSRSTRRAYGRWM